MATEVFQFVSAEIIIPSRFLTMPKYSGNILSG
jgi:hypothetical protein